MLSLSLLALSGLLAAPAGALPLAENGAARVALVAPPSPSAAETTALAELRHYLEAATGATYEVVAEADVAGPAIYLGDTRRARAAGLDAAAMDGEQWAIRRDGDALLLVGGRPRGTLYAVYRFLEDIVGVRWWSPWEESVPQGADLAVEALDAGGVPTFSYRDICPLYIDDAGRWAARNRLNRQGDPPIAAAYGGGMDYGPPYHVHTAYTYAPPERFFAEHPDWYAFRDGRRIAEGTQLCWTNSELQAFYIDKLRGYIEQARREAAAAGRPAPTVFDISQNDRRNPCQCDVCQAVVAEDGSECGPMLRFVNAVAEAIEGDYPEISIATLAYWHTEEPPAVTRPRDNVIVRLCDTDSNFTRPITHADNTRFRTLLEEWSRIAPRLRIWEYSVTYEPPYGLLLPNSSKAPTNYRFFRDHSVEGLFVEHEWPILGDLRDMKVWLQAKLLENAEREHDELVADFTDGFYGPAGAAVRDYLALREQAVETVPHYLPMNAHWQRARYLDLGFLSRAHELFDAAEAAVAGDPVLLRRVRHARLPVDRATVMLHPRLLREWMLAGNEADAMPLDRDAIAARYRQTWTEQAALRMDERGQQREAARADKEIARHTIRPVALPTPERFADLPAERVLAITPEAHRHYRDILTIVPDADAPSGSADRYEIPDAELDLYRLPMNWGLYDLPTGHHVPGDPIGADEVPGRGYHWYRFGRQPLRDSDYLYFFRTWRSQLDVASAFDPQRPEREVEIWAHIKFEGPAFPHGRADEANAISIDQVVFVLAE